ncbi:MAG: hypothetical protein Fur0021_05760 [Candidatus Promineifilaceae bacterium]
MTHELIVWHEKPATKELYLIAGWRQWADAGSISSGLPQYLIEHLGARLVGEIRDDSFYLFQIPGMHHFLRPEVKLEQGYRKAFTRPKNEFYYAGNPDKGLLIFLGDEPHLNMERYAAAFLDAVKTLAVRRIVTLGGVYGTVPFDRDRFISVIYSLPHLQEELNNYAVNFSNYEGGSSVGTYLADRAEPDNIELIGFYAFVPAYDFSQSETLPQSMRIENDYKAWLDILRRCNHMFQMELDLADLEHKSQRLMAAMEAKISELERTVPQLKVREYLAQLDEAYEEIPFFPLDDLWERELRDILKDLDSD